LHTSQSSCDIRTNEPWRLNQSSTSPTPSQKRIDFSQLIKKPRTQLHLKDYHQSLMASHPPKMPFASSNIHRSSSISIPRQNKQRYDLDFKPSLQPTNLFDKRLEDQPVYNEDDALFEMEM